MAFKPLVPKKCSCGRFELMIPESKLCGECRDKQLRRLIDVLSGYPSFEVVVSEKYKYAAFPLGYKIRHPFHVITEEWMPDDNILFRSPKHCVVFYRDTGDWLHIPTAKAYSVDGWGVVSVPGIWEQGKEREKDDENLHEV